MSEVVVVRDDNGGASTTPFSSLDDPQGGPGMRVVKQRALRGINALVETVWATIWP